MSLVIIVQALLVLPALAARQAQMAVTGVIVAAARVEAAVSSVRGSLSVHCDGDRPLRILVTDQRDRGQQLTPVADETPAQFRLCSAGRIEIDTPGSSRRLTVRVDF